jgi:hypothetical protein
MATAIVLIGILLLAAAAGFVLWWDKKRGKSSCGCDCGSCACAGACHGTAAAQRKTRIDGA